MKIGELAAATGLTLDTLRYYEKLQVLDPPRRKAKGYRRYGVQHLERVRFVQSAKALGFSLAEIAAFIPKLGAGKMGRADLEAELSGKLREVHLEITRLTALERKLTQPLSALSCPGDAPLSSSQATLNGPGEAVPVRSLKRTQAN